MLAGLVDHQRRPAASTAAHQLVVGHETATKAAPLVIGDTFHVGWTSKAFVDRAIDPLVSMAMQRAADGQLMPMMSALMADDTCHGVNVAGVGAERRSPPAVPARHCPEARQVTEWIGLIQVT